jgi:hypothetical protein
LREAIVDLAYGEWVEQCVLRPVPDRQYVFTALSEFAKGAQYLP